MSETKETWFPVKGYEGIYSVSDLGNVVSMNYRHTGMLQLMTPCKDSDGYLIVCLTKDGKQKTLTIHVLVMAAFVGTRPKGLQVNHKSGIKTDNRLVNLEYCTSSENRLHAYRTGLQSFPNGEDHPNAKLSKADVEAIRGRLAAGETQTKIAQSFGISTSNVSLLATNKRWNKVQKSNLQ